MRPVHSIQLAAALAAAALAAAAQMGYGERTGVNRQGYATDRFDGFEAYDLDKRTPQKEKSFWYSLSEETPEAQLAYARQKEAGGSFRRARKAYEALVRAWPTAPQAAEAQLGLAALLETNKKYEKAFEEYQYLLTFYASHSPYQEILERQYRIANHLLHSNRSMFGLALGSTDPIRERFEQIVRNAPRSPLAPEALLIIGSIRVAEHELDEAVAVYDGLLNRFPDAPQAVSAAFLAAQCRQEQAVKNSYNEARCREAIGFLKSVLARTPNHPQKEQLAVWKNELTALLIEQNYQQALFYDTRTRNAEAARAAYRRFLAEFSDSARAAHVRSRLQELEAGAPAPKPAR